MHLNVFYPGAVTDGCVSVVSVSSWRLYLSQCMDLHPDLQFPFTMTLDQGLHHMKQASHYSYGTGKWIPPAIVFWGIWLQTNWNKIFVTSQINSGHITPTKTQQFLSKFSTSFGAKYSKNFSGASICTGLGKRLNMTVSQIYNRILNASHEP